MTSDFAPIVLFVYNRPTNLLKTLEHLKQNQGASESMLYVFSDGPKNATDLKAVNAVREQLSEITGFRQTEIIISEKNKGLANSVIDGVSTVLKLHKKVIVLEDDLITSKSFLTYMNLTLNKYEKNKQIFSVSGFSSPLKLSKHYKYSAYFTKRHCSWGWGIWEDRWTEIDWQVKDYPEFATSRKMKKEFNRLGTDLSKALSKQMSGLTNSWAIRCNYHQFKKQTFTVYPTKSQIDNSGFGEEATHTRQKYNKFKTIMDNRDDPHFDLPENPVLDKQIQKEFNKTYSFSHRLKYFLLNKIA